MAKNVTHLKGFMEKKQHSIFSACVNDENRHEFADGGDFLLGILPPDSLLINAYVFTTTVADTAAVKLGTAKGGTEILSAGAIGTLGKTGTFTGMSCTGTGVPVYLNISDEVTKGDFVFIIQYLEYNKATGEYTRVCR